MTYPNDYLAIRALQAHLQPLFAADGVYGVHLIDSSTGDAMGADVVMARDEDTEVERVGRTYLLVDQQDGIRSEWSSGDADYRLVTVMVAACANDGSGAQVGTANPVSSPEIMSRDLVTEINANYTEWRDLGLLGIDINADKAIVSKTTDDSPGSTVVPHRITFHYHRA